MASDRGTIDVVVNIWGTYEDAGMDKSLKYSAEQARVRCRYHTCCPTLLASSPLIIC